MDSTSPYGMISTSSERETAWSYLEDQKTIVIQVNTFAFQEGSNLFTICRAAIDLVLASTIRKRYSGYYQVRIRNNSVGVRSRLD